MMEMLYLSYSGVNMEIKVDANVLSQVVDAIKKLPVQGDFDVADRWVGIVMILENMIQQGQGGE